MAMTGTPLTRFGIISGTLLTDAASKVLLSGANTINDPNYVKNHVAS